MKSRIKETNKASFHASTLSSEFCNTNNFSNTAGSFAIDSLNYKLNNLKSKTAKILNFYYEMSVSKNN
jgi:hypothetical protein